MNNNLKCSLLAIAVVTCGQTAWAQEILGKSPDGNVSAAVFVDDAGALRYRVDFKNVTVVEPSALGITVEGVKLGEGVSLGTPEESVFDEIYATRGNHQKARNHYSQWKFPITHKKTGKTYTLELRLYDDGAAYRYIVPGEGTQHVDGESSSWTIMENSKVWYFERLTPGWKLKSYAGEWMSTDVEKLDTATPASIGPIQGPPLVMELPGDIGFALITKAALYNYSGMRLKAIGDRTVVANFTEGDAGFDVEGDIVTPWRATLLADDLNELVNSDFINNLNPAPDPVLFADTSYIKPGRGVWSWETLGLGTPDTQRDFIDLAAELDYEYSLIDDGWKEWNSPWETIKELATHARSKNVGVWVWVHSKDIRNPENDWQQMKEYFDRTVDAGVVGIKTDFMDGETKELVDFEIAALRLAAERRLMIDFHGCHASTGEERTYPNEMTREGIRGIELNKIKEGPLPAAHNAALPFTRLAVGHADYTPILYTNPGPTTWAHQLATLVTYVSPLQIVAEHPDTMMKHPILKTALSVMKDVPTLWDETIVLPGSSIGDLSVFARRSGDTWFVSILNGADKRDYKLDLGFLSDGSYKSTLVEDDLTAEPVDVAKVGVNMKAKLRQWTTTVPFKVSSKLVDQTQSLDIELAVGGGFVARFIKK